MNTVKIAVIGVGSIAAEHINAYQKHSNVLLYAFCDQDEVQLHKMGELHGVTNLFTDVEELLKLEELDAVSICTWNVSHASLAIKALKAGKHVLSEKPMAKSLQEAIEMQAAADHSGKTLMIGFVRRFGNDTKILQDFIKKDFFGDFYYAKAQYIRRHGNPGGWFCDQKRSGGGPMIDLGVHVIDMVRYLMGNPKVTSVYGATFQKLDRTTVYDQPAYVSVSKSDHDVNDVEDLATALIRFETGAVLSVETSYSLHTKEDSGTIELFGTKGGAKMNPSITLYTDMHGYMVDVGFKMDTALSFSGLFESEINHFIDVIQNNVPCLAPSEDGVEVMRILDAIYRSAKTGHEILL